MNLEETALNILSGVMIEMLYSFQLHVQWSVCMN